jgi:hypothetical protein
VKNPSLKVKLNFVIPTMSAAIEEPCVPKASAKNDLAPKQTQSCEAAKDCSPRRKPWVKQKRASPGGPKEN